MGNPVAEYPFFVGDELQEFGVGRPVLTQPQVEGLFESPGGFTEIAEADHAPGAFEGVGTAADGGERILVMRVGAQACFLLSQFAEDFLAFLNEDGQQFSVDFFVAGACQLQGFCRGRRCLRCAGGKIGQGGFGFHAGGQCGQRGFGRLAQLAVGHQIGIFLDGFKVVLEFLLQAGIAGCLPQRVGERTGFPGLLRQFGFDGDVLGRVLCILSGGLTMQAGGEGVEIAFVIRQGVHEKAEQRELVSH